MPRAHNQDPESGPLPGMLSTMQFISLDLSACTVDGHLEQPPSPSNQSFHGETKFDDSSGPLFTLYSRITEKEDNTMVQRWQKDAEGIIIFVRQRSWALPLRTHWMVNRTAFSLLSSLYLSLYPSKTSGPTRRTFPRSISGTSINYLPIPTFLAFPTLLLCQVWLDPRRSPHRDIRSGSTHSGS
jgi:hypothetical protein